MSGSRWDVSYFYVLGNVKPVFNNCRSKFTFMELEVIVSQRLSIKPVSSHLNITISTLSKAYWIIFVLFMHVLSIIHKKQNSSLFQVTIMGNISSVIFCCLRFLNVSLKNVTIVNYSSPMRLWSASIYSKNVINIHALDPSKFLHNGHRWQIQDSLICWSPISLLSEKPTAVRIVAINSRSLQMVEVTFLNVCWTCHQLHLLIANPFLRIGIVMMHQF